MAKTVKETEPFPSFYNIVELNKVFNVLWIGGNVPSLKNSKEIVNIKLKITDCCGAPIARLSKGSFYCTHCKKPARHKTSPRLIPQKAVQRYIKEFGSQYKSSAFKERFSLWLKMSQGDTLYLGFYFVRKTVGKWDFNNITQLVTDQLRDNMIIKDDDVTNIIPIYLGHHKNADKPGVILVPLFNFNNTIENHIDEQTNKFNTRQHSEENLNDGYSSE